MKKDQRTKIVSLLKLSFPSADSVNLGGTTIEVGTTPIQTMGSYNPVGHFKNNPLLSINFTLTHTLKSVVDFIRCPKANLTECKSKTIQGNMVASSYHEDMLNQRYITDCTIQIPAENIEEFIKNVEKDLKTVIHDAFYASVE